MCLNGVCFRFSDYAGKKVAVFVSGPGYLEYPWALETAFRLKHAGAEVIIFDFSDFASPYAMRIKVLGVRLPIRSRQILRSMLLSKQSTIENVLKKASFKNGIEYSRIRIPTTCQIQFGSIQLKSLKGQKWGPLDAFEIIQSTLSSFEKRSLGPEDYISKSLVSNIKFAIKQTELALYNLEQFNIDTVFLANGRQPTQATITLAFRNSGTDVVLYESGGGYIYPSVLKKRLDYFLTSPANSEELRQKIMCKSFFQKGNLELAKVVHENILKRDLIPYKLNYLTDEPTSFDLQEKNNGRNFAFFATSEWEISILQGKAQEAIRNSEFPNQVAAVQAIVDLLNDGDRLYLRLHPSDPGNHAEAESKWDAFKANPKVTMFLPSSRINSYEIAQEMDANFVWASFLGFELALRGIPSAVLGDAVYAPCFQENWIREKAKLKDFMSDPREVTKDLLLHYSKYLAEGGFEITESSTDGSRKIDIQDLKVDCARPFFTWLPKSWLASIS
jgi:hypothetical protein